MSEVKKLIVRLRGGVGNQLFTYAAALRLATASGAELVVDSESGFRRDYVYKRRYALDQFSVSARVATSWERLEPFDRVRRALLKIKSRLNSYDLRSYIEQESAQFDARLLAKRVHGTLYLDGYWQNEGYFKDIEPAVRREFTIKRPTHPGVRLLEKHIDTSEAVAVHIRWFVGKNNASSENVPRLYYERALQYLRMKLTRPQVFVFSDDRLAAQELLRDQHGFTYIDVDAVDAAAVADLYLMSKCRHFIIANSTFSFWGAWLGERPGSHIVAPASGFLEEGTIPARWKAL